MQHQALAALRDRLVEPAPQRRPVGDARLGHGFQLRPAGGPGESCDRLHTVGKRSGRTGQLEEQVAKLPPPRIVGRVGSDDGGQRIEAAAPEP